MMSWSSPKQAPKTFSFKITYTISVTRHSTWDFLFGVVQSRGRFHVRWYGLPNLERSLLWECPVAWLTLTRLQATNLDVGCLQGGHLFWEVDLFKSTKRKHNFVIIIDSKLNSLNFEDKLGVLWICKFKYWTYNPPFCWTTGLLGGRRYWPLLQSYSRDPRWWALSTHFWLIKHLQLIHQWQRSNSLAVCHVHSQIDERKYVVTLPI